MLAARPPGVEMMLLARHLTVTKLAALVDLSPGKSIKVCLLLCSGLCKGQLFVLCSWSRFECKAFLSRWHVAGVDQVAGVGACALCFGVWGK